MILEARNLTKSFRLPEPITLFSGISLQIAAGESIAITGRSGEGKTTLLHVLGTLEAPDTGEILIHNIPFSTSNGPFLRNRYLGFVFQSFNLLDDFSALDNVLMPARIGRKPLDLEWGSHLLELVGLKHRIAFPAKLLSGGEKQRVAIARALCNNPDLILADEPSGNLDRQNSQAIGELLLSITEQQNKGLILVTHDASLSRLCKRQYLLQEASLHENF